LHRFNLDDSGLVVEHAFHPHLLSRELLRRGLVAQHVHLLPVVQGILSALGGLHAVRDTLRVRLDLHHPVVELAHGISDDAGKYLRLRALPRERQGRHHDHEPEPFHGAASTLSTTKVFMPFFSATTPVTFTSFSMKGIRTGLAFSWCAASAR